MIVKQTKFLLACILVLFVISGCKTFMPSGREYTKSPLKTYDDVMSKFNKIEEGKTTSSGLREMGLDPHKTPNTVYLDPLSVRDLLLGNSPLFRKEYLPKGALDCLENLDRSYGYEFHSKNIKKHGQGSFFLRMFDFKKEDLTTGIDVSFSIFLVDDLVVYKLAPKGIPDVHKVKIKKKPLGFLQDIGNIIGSGIRSLFP